MDRISFNKIKKMAREDLFTVEKGRNLMTCTLIVNGEEKEVGVFMISDNFDAALRRMTKLIEKSESLKNVE